MCSAFSLDGGAWDFNLETGFPYFLQRASVVFLRLHTFSNTCGNLCETFGWERRTRCGRWGATAGGPSRGSAGPRGDPGASLSGGPIRGPRVLPLDPSQPHAARPCRVFTGLPPSAIQPGNVPEKALGPQPPATEQHWDSPRAAINQGPWLSCNRPSPSVGQGLLPDRRTPAHQRTGSGGVCFRGCSTDVNKLQ